MKFTTAVHLAENGGVRKMSGTNLWEVILPFVWYVDYENKKKKITVELGQVTDFGSIPRVFWLFFNPTKWISYILHDEIYNKKGVMNDDGVTFYLTRSEADAIMRQALILEGCNQVSAYLQWLAVRIGGWWNWYKT